MDRFVSGLVLVSALSSNACTVVADVDYRATDSNNAAMDILFTGAVSFQQEQYTDPGAPYASALDVELDVDLPLEIWFRTTIGDWIVDPRGICEIGTVVATQASTSMGLQRRLDPLLNASASVCISDQGEMTGGDSLSFVPSYTGSPPPDQEEFLPGEIFTQLVIEGTIPDVYEGADITPAVAGSVSLTAAQFRHQLLETDGANAGRQLTVAIGTFNGLVEGRR